MTYEVALEDSRRAEFEDYSRGGGGCHPVRGGMPRDRSLRGAPWQSPHRGDSRAALHLGSGRLAMTPQATGSPPRAARQGALSPLQGQRAHRCTPTLPSPCNREFQETSYEAGGGEFPRPLPAPDESSADTPPRGGPRGCSARGKGVGREDRDVQWPQILSESPAEATGKAESV